MEERALIPTNTGELKAEPDLTRRELLAGTLGAGLGILATSAFSLTMRQNVKLISMQELLDSEPRDHLRTLLIVKGQLEHSGTITVSESVAVSRGGDPYPSRVEYDVPKYTLSSDSGHSITAIRVKQTADLNRYTEDLAMDSDAQIDVTLSGKLSIENGEKVFLFSEIL